MTTLETLDCHSEVLNYFQKFKENDNFSSHYEKLEELSKFRIRENHSLGVFKIPDIGPSKEILKFHKKLKNWKEEEKEEIKFFLKLFEGSGIEKDEEALIIIEILINSDKENLVILNNLKKCILNEDFSLDSESLLKLLDIEETHKIFYNSLFEFFSNKFT